MVWAGDQAENRSMSQPQIRVVVPRELESWCDGQDELSVAAGSARGVLSQLAKQFPQLHVRLCDEQGELRPHINLFVNDVLCPRTALDTSLKQGDVVMILPAVSGG